MSPLDWAVIAGYLVVMFTIGHYAARRAVGARGYFLGGRQMPTWAVTLSVVATNLSVATFVGAPQESFGGDLTYLSVNIGYLIAACFVAAVFLPRLYQAGTVTIYGYLGQRFGERAVMGASITFLVGRLLASGVRLFIAAIPVCLLMYGSIDPTKKQLITAIIIIGGVGVAYTVAGGIRAVIWTDTMQIAIVCGAAILSVGLLLHAIPLPVAGIWHTLHEQHKLVVIDPTFDLHRKYGLWAVLIGATFLGTASNGTDHDIVQRMLTTKSKFRASLSLVASSFVTTALQLLFLVIGLLLYIYYKRPDIMGASGPRDAVGTSMQVYPQFLLNHLPIGVKGLAIAGMFAAAQGSLDSAINAMASSAIADIYWPMRARSRRAATAVGPSIKLEDCHPERTREGSSLDVPARSFTSTFRMTEGDEQPVAHSIPDPQPTPPDSEADTKSPRIAVAIMGGLLILFAIGAATFYDPKDTLIAFALGVMSFAYTGLLGVFLTAMLTKRGNSTSAIAALISGGIITAALQPFTTAGNPHFIMASFWIMPIGTTICFLICCAGNTISAEGT